MHFLHHLGHRIFYLEGSCLAPETNDNQMGQGPESKVDGAKLPMIIPSIFLGRLLLHVALRYHEAIQLLFY